MQPAFYGWTTIDVWESVNRVWKNVLEWKSTVSVDAEGIHWTPNGPSIIVRVTRVLLSLVVALSITMILKFSKKCCIHSYMNSCISI